MPGARNWLQRYHLPCRTVGRQVSVLKPDNFFEFARLGNCIPCLDVSRAHALPCLYRD